jgi:hypothetical protein
MGTSTSAESPVDTARDRRRALRATAPLLIRPFVPLLPVAGFLAAALLIGFAILLAALRPVAATLAACGPLLLIGLWMLAAAVWSEAHHAAVSQALDAQRGVRQASMRRHPILWLTALPLVAGARAAARMETGHGHPALVVVLAVGLGVWATALVAVFFGIRRAHAAR